MIIEKERLTELSNIAVDLLGFLKYVKIQEPGQLTLDYELWPHLLDFFRNLDLYPLNILLKSKQIGVSWAIATRALWRIYTTPGSNILELSSGQKEAQKLLGKSRIIYNNLPDWMKIYTVYPDSTEQFGFRELRSTITALPSTEKAGIGETSDWVVHDEADFHDFFEVNLSHTLATVADSPVRELTIVSTVDKTKPDSAFKQLYKVADEKLNSFNPLFYRYDVRPNRDVNWYEQEARLHTDKPWEMEANYPQSAKEALSPLAVQSCFNQDKLKQLWENVTEPETRQGFIYILCPPRVGTQYVAGADVGEGVGLDYSCLTIVGKQGLNSEVVAVIYSNQVATDSFAEDCDKLCREYKNALLAVENNSLGVAVTNKLQELGCPNLFSSEAERKRQHHTPITGSEKVGWTTGESNKRTGIVGLVENVNNGSLTTRFKPQVKEMMEYQWVNAKPVPTGKTHGDTVISLMLANQMLKRVGNVIKASMFIKGRRVF